MDLEPGDAGRRRGHEGAGRAHAAGGAEPRQRRIRPRSAPGGEPYRRQTITFETALDRELGIELVRVARTGVDGAPFPLRYDPGHPAADADGYVLLPNVNPLLEMMDLREAQRSFEANLNALTLARSMVQRTLDLLR